MNRMRIILIIAIIGLFLPTLATAENRSKKSPSRKVWKLAWKEEFKGKKIDTTSWQRCIEGGADWSRHMSPLDTLCQIKNGVLELWATTTPEGVNDSRPYLTGGVQSKDLRSIKNGRIEVRARFDCARGFWPAIWLMPDIEMKWPYGGEIDIMEHLNFEDIVYQTIHTAHTYFHHEPKSKNHQTTPIKKEEFNTYAVEISDCAIIFYINNKKQFTYPKMTPTPEGQYPFADHPFYIILSAQLGGEWVGKVNPDDLPVKMEIDYVKFYERR